MGSNPTPSAIWIDVLDAITRDRDVIATPPGEVLPKTAKRIRTEMPQFFISYRRSDQEGQYLAHMIFRELRSRYGPDSAFLDVDSRSPGLSFPAKVAQALKVTDVVLVIIGPLWLQRLNERLEDSRDWVHYEVAESLKRDSLPVVPICRAGVEIPRPHELPEDLKDLSLRDGITLDPFQDFDIHLARLLSDLEAMLAASQRKKEEGKREALVQKRTAPQPIDAPPSASKVNTQPTSNPSTESEGSLPAKSYDPRQSWWLVNRRDGIDDEKRLDRLASAILKHKRKFLDLPTSTSRPSASFSSEPRSKTLDETDQEAPAESFGPIAQPAAAPSWKIGSSLAIRALIHLTLVLLLLAQRGSVLPYGTLVLSAVPWGEVSEILDANGKTQPLGPQKITPLVLPLPVGTYTVTLRNRSFPEPVSLNVTVVTGARVPKLAEFEKPAASKKEFFKELGFREPSL